MIPIKIGDDRVMYLKNPVPAMQLTNFIADGNLMNNLFNNSNPMIKYLISSGAGNVNLFFGNKYDTQAQQLYDILVPKDLKAPYKLLDDFTTRPEDRDWDYYDSLEAMFPAILKQENMSDQRIRKLEMAVKVYKSYLDSILTQPQQRLLLQKAYPILNYSPFKIEIV